MHRIRCISLNVVVCVVCFGIPLYVVNCVTVVCMMPFLLFYILYVLCCSVDMFRISFVDF